MSIQGNDGFLDLENASLRVTGNVHAEGLKVGSVRLQPAYSLQSVTNISNTTTQMVQFTNPTKGFDVTSNIEVGDANLYVDTTTGRVGVGTNAPMGTLDVKGVLNHTQVANVAQITSNSNVVMEYKLSTRDYETKEPRFALTASSDRGYVASASSSHPSFTPNHAFDNVDSTFYHTDGTQYVTATGAYQGSNTLNGVNGEWLSLQLPNKIDLSSVHIYPRTSLTSQSADSITIVGSNDGSSWTTLTSVTGLTYTDSTATIINVNSNTGYKYFAIIAQKVLGTNGGTGSGAGHWVLTTLELYGTAESTPVLARLGGSFEGKIANTRVYDRSIGERQVLEIWDAEKDRFGRGESSITVHKGRLGVGTKTPQATLDVRGNIFGPLLTHRSYVWRKPGLTYVPANQECRILAQVVEIPEMYKNISPLNLRLSYRWQWFGETANNAWQCYWRTNVKHSGNTVEHMNTGMEGLRDIMVAMSLHTGYPVEYNSGTPRNGIRSWKLRIGECDGGYIRNRA